MISQWRKSMYRENSECNLDRFIECRVILQVTGCNIGKCNSFDIGNEDIYFPNLQRVCQVHTINSRYKTERSSYEQSEWKYHIKIVKFLRYKMLHIYHIDMTLYVHYFSLSNDIYFYINVLFFLLVLLNCYFSFSFSHAHTCTHARMHAYIFKHTQIFFSNQFKQ